VKGRKGIRPARRIAAAHRYPEYLVISGGLYRGRDPGDMGLPRRGIGPLWPSEDTRPRRAGPLIGANARPRCIVAVRVRMRGAAFLAVAWASDRRGLSQFSSGHPRHRGPSNGTFAQARTTKTMARAAAVE
jgi:hypothetical protein